MIIELREKQDLDALLKQSHQSPVLLFKHSTQCSRSAVAMEELEAFLRNNPTLPCGLVLVIEDRQISDDIEDRFGIQHESPQAILVVDETPMWFASHWKVSESALQSAIGSAVK